MIYLDTSALLPLFLSEDSSPAVRRRLGGLAPGEAAVSDWALVEFASALGARVRARHLSRQAGHASVCALEDLVAASCRRLSPQATDFAAAQRLVGNFNSGLRAGDALHLALAVRHRAELYTLDRLMQKAARALGLRCL